MLTTTAKIPAIHYIQMMTVEAMGPVEATMRQKDTASKPDINIRQTGTLESGVNLSEKLLIFN